MQGRLSTRSALGPQVFPPAWRTEFAVARELGFGAIEWLVEAGSVTVNPLMTPEGRREMKQAMSSSGIRVASMCAHCVLQWRPFDNGGEARMAPFAAVIAAARDAGVERVVVPILEDATVAKAKSLGAAAEILRPAVQAAEAAGVDLAFEMDLPAADCGEFVRLLDSSRARLCYDSGNATAQGRDIVAEVVELLPRVAEIHIKDRRVGGASQALGQGETKFGDFFDALIKQNWRGPLVLETPVLDDPLGQARQNLAFVQKFLS